MELILIGLAVAPGLAISLFIFFLDKFEKEPLHLLTKCFVLGALSTLLALGLGELENYFYPISGSSASIALDAFVYVAFSEELSKFIFLRWYAYNKPSFNEPYDGIMYSVMVSMGFATTENLIYVLDGGLEVALIRMLTAVPAHATFAILMGYFVGLAKFRVSQLPYFALSLISATVLHGMYDFCLFMYHDKYSFLILGALLSLITGIVLSKKAIVIHNNISPFKTQEKKTLQS